MRFFYLPIGITVLSNTLYHIVLKLTPSNINPMITLAVSYIVSAIVCLLLLPVFPLKASLSASLHQLNWASIALGVVIVGLEVGFLMAYRVGWKISLAGIISNAGVALLLIPIGLLIFKEKISAVNIAGVIVCVIGLVLANLR